MEAIRIVIEAEQSPLTDDLEKRIRYAIDGFGRAVTVVLTGAREGVPSARQIPVRVGRRIRMLDPTEIVYARSEDDHCLVVTEAGEYVVRSSLSRLESMLPESRWLRVHRRHLVRIDRIEGWHVDSGGSMVLRLRAPWGDIPVSRSRKAGVRSAMGAIGRTG